MFERFYSEGLRAVHKSKVHKLPRSSNIDWSQLSIRSLIIQVTVKSCEIFFTRSKSEVLRLELKFGQELFFGGLYQCVHLGRQRLLYRKRHFKFSLSRRRRRQNKNVIDRPTACLRWPSQNGKTFETSSSRLPQRARNDRVCSRDFHTTKMCSSKLIAKSVFFKDVFIKTNFCWIWNPLN